MPMTPEDEALIRRDFEDRSQFRRAFRVQEVEGDHGVSFGDEDEGLLEQIWLEIGAENGV